MPAPRSPSMLYYVVVIHDDRGEWNEWAECFLADEHGSVWDITGAGLNRRFRWRRDAKTPKVWVGGLRRLELYDAITARLDRRSVIAGVRHPRTETYLYTSEGDPRLAPDIAAHLPPPTPRQPSLPDRPRPHRRRGILRRLRGR